MEGKPAILPQFERAFVSRQVVTLQFPEKCKGISDIVVALALRY